jgi:hypothetical protein
MEGTLNVESPFSLMDVRCALLRVGYVIANRED